jgi:D-amino peptidase
MPKIRSRTRALGIVLSLAASGLLAQDAASGKLKVFISADMEGVGGVSTWSVQASSKGREYEKFRQLMTREVNAAIEGAFQAGATEVLVGDSHGDAQNIDVELLDKRVRLIRAWPRPLGMMQGIDSTFGAAVFVGYHAAEGRENATLSHSFSGTIEVALDGVTVPEAGFNAAIAGDFGVPVVFLSGDQTICADARKLLGPIETAAVKDATGFYSATMMHPEEAQRLIREGVRRGVERRREIKPYKIAHPVRLQVRFNEIVNAEVVAMLPGVERPAGNVIVFQGRDMVEVSKFFEAISNIRAQ